MTATRYYEDLETGETLESGTMRVTKDEVLAFARKYDPQYFHADEEAARDPVFGEVVASGIHTMAMWRQLDHQIAADIAWICGVAWDDVRFPRAVPPWRHFAGARDLSRQAPVAQGPGTGGRRIPLRTLQSARRDRLRMRQHQSGTTRPIDPATDRAWPPPNQPRLRPTRRATRLYSSLCTIAGTFSASQSSCSRARVLSPVCSAQIRASSIAAAPRSAPSANIAGNGSRSAVARL